jgi:hypothetical protein
MVLRDFEMRNSNGSKTASSAIGMASNVGPVLIRNVKVAHSTNKYWKGFACSDDTDSVLIRDCEFGYMTNVGIEPAGYAFKLLNNYIHDCASHGVNIRQGASGSSLFFNILANNGGDGLHSSWTGGNGGAEYYLIGNTFTGNTGDGWEDTGGTSSTLRALQNLVCVNNDFDRNGGYGINLSGSGVTAAMLDAVHALFEGNNFYSNTSGKYNISGMTSEDEQTLDPQFTNSAGGDYSIGTNLKAKGYPVGGTLAVGTTSATSSYVDIGAAQRICAAILGYLLVKN